MASPKELFAKLRSSRPSVDHLVRAFSRYSADTGDRLAAAVTFFGFLSFFPLLALAASLLALFLHGGAVDTVIRGVNSYSPGLADQLGLRDLLQNNTKAGVTGLISLAGLLFSGLGWVEALRDALRTVWHQNVQAGNFVKKKLADVVVLAGLGAAFILSFAVTSAASSFTGTLLGWVGLEGSTVATVLLRVLALALAVLSSTVIFLFLFIRLPRVQTPWRRVLKGALLAAVLFEVLKVFGAFYIGRTTSNPLYGTFAVVVGLLVWINLVSRMLLVCAAWTVTAPYDSDVAPSGTADAEQAEKAGIPLSFADGDPDDPPVLQDDGAPTPLRAAVQGKTPPQDQPQGKPGQEESPARSARRADVPPEESERADAGINDAGLSDAITDDPYPADPQDRRPVGRAGRPSDGAGHSGTSGGGRPSSGTGATPGANSSDAPADGVLAGEVAARRAAQAGAALIGAGVMGVGVYAVRTAAGVLRR